MQIIKVIKNPIKKLRDRMIFHSFWLRRISKCNISVSKTILVIRIDAIGDCIIWLDQAKEYRKAFPDYHIVLLHNKVWIDIASRLPWFDECIPFDRTLIGNVKYYKGLLTTINKYTYEKVFSPVFSRDFITVDWLIHNINAIEKIGYSGDYQNNYGISVHNIYYRNLKKKPPLKEIADNWYTYLVTNNPENNMELQRNAHFIRQTINKDFKSRLPIIPFNIPKFKSIPLSEYALFFVGASVEYRMWPIKRFVSIVQYIPYKTIVLCGAMVEQPLAKDFLSLYNGGKNIIDLTGATTLIELISIIDKAKIVISNETSASHIAIATRTPSICLLGGGHYGRFHPYQIDIIDDYDLKYIPTLVTSNDRSCFNCNWGCYYPFYNGRWKCINDILTKDVIDAIKGCVKNNYISQ